jgi:hypothetical protein
MQLKHGVYDIIGLNNFVYGYKRKKFPEIPGA